MSKKISLIAHFSPWHLPELFSSAYRGSPPCALFHNPDNKEILYSNVLAGAASCIKEFSFTSSKENTQLSSAILPNSPIMDLPEKFTICFAMKKDKIDGTSPFLIRDRNKHPWIAPSMWKLWNGVSLWFDSNKGEWLEFHEMEKP